MNSSLTLLLQLFSTLIVLLKVVLTIAKDTPEALVRQAINDHRSASNNERWNAWSSLTWSLLSMPDNLTESNSDHLNTLEIVEVFEESILFIERSIFQSGEADDPVRDAALANLYYGYSKTLLELSADQCIELALNPHTLLIGAEKASRAHPSTALCRENAENHLRNAATLDATNEKATSLLSTVLDDNSIEGVHKRKPKEFVAELFDSFADTFDDKLVKGLKYKVPELIGEAVSSLLKDLEYDHFQNVLDAGCGTGLAGRYLRPFTAGSLIGVDASQKMLDIAKKCTVTTGCGLEDTSKVGIANLEPLYDGLFALDLEEMTVENTLKLDGVTRKKLNNVDGYDLVVAADVLVYFGDLSIVLRKFADVSIHGSHLIFSCERTSIEEAPLGWRLMPSGRFSHTQNHVVEAAVAAGYTLVEYSEIVPRMERGVEVQGHLFIFKLTSTGISRLDEL